MHGTGSIKLPAIAEKTLEDKNVACSEELTRGVPFENEHKGDTGNKCGVLNQTEPPPVERCDDHLTCLLG